MAEKEFVKPVVVRRVTPVESLPCQGAGCENLAEIRVGVPTAVIELCPSCATFLYVEFDALVG